MQPANDEWYEMRSRDYTIIDATKDAMLAAETTLAPVYAFRVYISANDVAALQAGKALIFAVNDGEYSLMIHSNPDARDWKEFVKP